MCQTDDWCSIRVSRERSEYLVLSNLLVIPGRGPALICSQGLCTYCLFPLPMTLSAFFEPDTISHFSLYITSLERPSLTTWFKLGPFYNFHSITCLFSFLVHTTWKYKQLTYLLFLPTLNCNSTFVLLNTELHHTCNHTYMYHIIHMGVSCVSSREQNQQEIIYHIYEIYCREFLYIRHVASSRYISRLLQNSKATMMS